MDSQRDYPMFLICLFVFLGLCGCVSSGGVESDPIMLSTNRLHQAARFALMDSIKSRSQNTRTYISHHHIPGTDVNALAKPGEPRGQVSIHILGDRRPYRLLVVYRVDKFEQGAYHFDRYDKKIAQKFLKRMQDYLASRPVERDMIDDFRPY